MKIIDNGLLKTFVRDELPLFCSFIREFYADHGRKFAWRDTNNPYHIFISEVMLQQTQTTRVIQKYEQFIDRFPTVASLASAELRMVLAVWQGLGYNRRGKFLHQAAQIIVSEYDGFVPQEPVKLKNLPGIGQATAASIAAFAFNRPTVFIETNIRAVFLHCFFSGQTDVPDAQLLPLVAATVDQANPRHWYYALMDYGVYLKKQIANPSRASRHHTCQSRFEGSDRQIRGMIIRLLTQQRVLSREHICSSIAHDSNRVLRILTQLCSEQLVHCSSGYCSIA